MIINKRSIIASILTVFTLFLTKKFWFVNTFETEVFVTILIFSFLLFYKLADYTANYKTLKGKSRIDIVFLLVLFIILFIPMFNIDKRTISIEENRMLAVYKPFYKDNNINLTFGKDFEKWFSDRFYFRKNIINFYYISKKFDKYWITNRVIKGKSGWLFFKTDYRPLNKAQLEKIKRYLVQIDKKCKEKNKKFYFVIVPDKEQIYNEYFTDKIKLTESNSKGQQLAEYLKENTDLKFLYLKDNLLSNKNKGLLYFKEDSHWNSLGGYYAYLDMMNLINEDYKNIDVYIVKRYKQSSWDEDLKNMLPNVLKFHETVEYKVPDLSDRFSTCNFTGRLVNNETVYCKNNKNFETDIKLTMYVDSFADALVEYFAETFKETKNILEYNIKESDITNSDIIILETVERRLPMLAGSNIETDI